MKIEEIRLHFPGSPDEAVNLLATLSGGVRVLAGGTDLLADLKQEKLAADHVVSLAKIPGLDRIERSPDGLVLGALVTANRLASSPEVRETLPALADAAGVMGGNQIRNLATLGGNLASAVPSADLPPSLLVAGARALLYSPRGSRSIPLGEFFTGPRTTVLAPDEILTAMEVPIPPRDSGSAYLKFQLRDASALAVVGVAAFLALDGDRIEKARIAVGAASPVPLLVPEAAERLEGEEPAEEGFRAAAAVVARTVRPISDLRGSAEFRRNLSEVLSARALSRALSRARGEEVVRC